MQLNASYTVQLKIRRVFVCLNLAAVTGSAVRVRTPTSDCVIQIRKNIECSLSGGENWRNCSPLINGLLQNKMTFSEIHYCVVVIDFSLLL